VRTFSVQALVGGSIQLLLFPLVLFSAAGTLAWPACWIFLLLFYCFVAVVVRRLARRDPVLLEERMSVFKVTSRWEDRMFLLLVVVSLAWLLVMPLDVVRLRWSQLPPSLQMVGVLVLAGAFTMMYLAFRANAYVTPTVRIQQERGQTVVSSGPYRYVRHPMYTGFHLFFLGLPLLLGSLAGLVLAPLLIALVVRRAVLEERLLYAQLPGYDSYLAHVRYRFIPHLW
jgi:protein-S-isoprenylcysteine O-methyltransferase Ste14